MQAHWTYAAPNLPLQTRSAFSAQVARPLPIHPGELPQEIEQWGIRLAGLTKALLYARCFIISPFDPLAGSVPRESDVSGFPMGC